MAAGKSSVGRQLAEQLSFRFVDSDQEIESRCGADVSWIFDVEGEAGFRRRETAVLEELSQAAKIVIATGGGAILSPQNRALMAERGIVVYLQAPLEVLVARTEKDKKRPLLQQGDRRQILADLLDVRGPLYEEVAHITVSTEHCNMRQTLTDITSQLSPFLASAV